MSENDPFRHLPDSLIQDIPVNCAACPALLGFLSVHNSFIDEAIRRRKKSFNPVTKLANLVSQKFSEARLYSAMNDRLYPTKDCSGMIAYPANSQDPLILCGLGVRDALSEQITNQPLRTQ